MNNIKIRYWLFFQLFLWAWSAQAQDNNLLRRNVTLAVQERPLENVLLDISEKAGFTFSYDASILSNNTETITYSLKNESVKSTLDKLLPENIDYKVSGNHLILLEKSSEAASRKKEKYTVSGRVYSNEDNTPLKDVVVYEVSSLASSVTDSEGRFSMVIPAHFQHYGVAFNHQYFHEELIFLTPKDQTLTVTIKPKRERKEIDKLESIPVSSAPVESLSLVRSLVPSELFVRTKNMDLVRQVTAQLSFLPSIGTNLKMGGLIENNFSINILAGYAYGVNKFEMGGLVNIIRKDVKGIQIAGIGNVVGQNIQGVQFSGLFNYDRGSLKGVQIAGISNMLKDSLAGTQIAGIGNTANGHLKGVQFAGLYNYAEENVGGTQVSGLMNLATKDVQSLQLAGAYNKAGNVGGTQVAGLVNYSTGTVKGVQVAGFANKAKTVEAFQLSGIANLVEESVSGAQISGFLNYAQYVGGSQIGLINIADSASGIPVGFFSYIKHGHRRLEFYTSEILPANIAFKTGVKRFYNIFTGGIGAWSGHGRLSLGYGAGTEKALSENTAINFELTNHIIFEKVGFQKDFNSLMRLSVNLVRIKSKNIGFSIGPSLNILYSDIDAGGEQSNTPLAPYTLIDTKIGNGFGQVWIGGKATVYWEL